MQRRVANGCIAEKRDGAFSAMQRRVENGCIAEKRGTNAAGDQSALWAAVNSKALLVLSRSPGL